MSKKNPYAAKSKSDAKPVEVVEETVEVPTGTVKEVLEWVGDDKERAQLALDAETESTARKSLIQALEEVIDA